MQMNQCAPNVRNNSFTCFTYQQLKSIAEKFNQTSDEKIKISKRKDVLWKKIYEKMKYKCNDELCWANNDKMVERFRPKRPIEWHSNPREWLSNFDIHKVMVQYEKKYKTFKFLGVFPDDYDYKIFMNTCVAEELCKLDVAGLLKDNKYQLGMVFNTDPHYLGGSHWVAIYANINESSDKYGFYYYDSNAQEPSKYIIKLFNQIRAQLTTKKTRTKTRTGKEFKISINNNKHQFKNTECGMFSMNFIINMLKVKNTFENVCNSKTSDDEVFKLREKYFN